jgi:hypothetical protein
MTMTLAEIGTTDVAETLLQQLAECSCDLLRNVERMAAIVKRLDELGVRVAIENSLLPYIRLIAHGQLSSELFITCSGDMSLLEKAMRLPMPLQKQVACNEPFKIMDLGGDHRMVRPLDMTKRERRQVFVGKRLRTETEQIGWLRDQERAAKLRHAAPDEPEVSIDKKRRGIVVSGKFISLPELLNYIAALNR